MIPISLRLKLYHCDTDPNFDSIEGYWVSTKQKRETIYKVHCYQTFHSTHQSKVVWFQVQQVLKMRSDFYMILNIIPVFRILSLPFSNPSVYSVPFLNDYIQPLRHISCELFLLANGSMTLGVQRFPFSAIKWVPSYFSVIIASLSM